MRRHNTERASVCVEEEWPALVPRPVRRPHWLRVCVLCFSWPNRTITCLFLVAQSHHHMSVSHGPIHHHMSVSVYRICLGLVGFADVGDWQSGVLCGCRHVCCKCDGYGTVSMDVTDGSWRGTATKNSISVRPRMKNECHHCLGMACTNHSLPSIVRRWMSDTVTPSPSCSIARICPR